MRHARRYVTLAVVAVALLGLASMADVVALQVAQSKAAAGFAHATASERAAVDLGGFPFLPNLFGGHVRHGELHARGLSGAGLRVNSLDVRLDDIRFSPSGVIALIRSEHATRTRITAANPYGRAEITEADLTEFVRGRQREVHDVRVTPSGIEVRWGTGDAISPPARFLPRIEDRRLVLTLIGLGNLPKAFFEPAHAIEHSIDLPPIPKGVRVDVRLGQGVFTLEAAGPGAALLVGEGGVTSA